MKFIKPLFQAAIAFTIGFGTIQQLPANAATFTETTDAGQSLTDFQEVGYDINAIIGSIDTATDVDLYELNLADGLFMATTVRNVTNNLDTMLWLFDSEGRGIVGNDDSFGTSQSTIRANLGQGKYYLGISNYDIEPTSITGLIFDYTSGSSRTKLLQPTGVGGNETLNGNWVVGPNGNPPQTTGRYRIILNQSTIKTTPEPSAVLGFVVLALGLSWKRTKHKHQV